MQKHIGTGGATAICLALSAPVALADITADDVWADWQSYMSQAGYDVTAGEARSGSQLTITDMSMSLAIPEEDATLSLNLGSISMVENGDGSVNIEFPNPMPIGFSVTGDGADQVRGTVIMTHTGSVMQVVGDPNSMTYTHSSSSNEITLGDITVGGQPMPPGVADVKITFSDTSGITRMTTGDLREFDQTYNVGSLAYDIAVSDPGSSDGGSMKGALTGLQFSGAGAMPKDVDPTDMAAMMAAGMKVDGTISYASGNSDIKGQDGRDQFAMTTSSSGGDFGVRITSTNLRYSILSRNLDISVTSSELPFPVQTRFDESGFTLDAPVAKSDSPQDFQLGINLTGFSISDMIWSLFDPASVLPRDPATIVMDVSGQARMLMDLLNPESLMAMENSPTPPAELNSLSINKLLVSLVGASLSGNGAFTFDNSDLQTFDGVPRPTGAVNLQLVGGNGLIDKLIQMGFVSDQDAMGARMMMGMLAVPGDAPDTLNSKIEVNAQGHVLANGQRIQ
ncbi:MAG: DUF2125 domain-containing protein [Arenibacterium sp.]